jgi:hypothetical protein
VQNRENSSGPATVNARARSQPIVESQLPISMLDTARSYGVRDIPIAQAASVSKQPILVSELSGAKLLAVSRQHPISAKQQPPASDPIALHTAIRSLPFQEQKHRLGLELHSRISRWNDLPHIGEVIGMILELENETIFKL